jgi:large subunit ribosomal protein L9
MKILLLYDVDRLGKQGEIVSVRPGYARNYLIPKRLATTPHAGAQKELDLVRRRQQKIEREMITAAEGIAAALEKIPSITLELRANAEGALFGSVSPSMVTQALRDHQIKLDAKQVEIAETIKQVGNFTVQIRLYKEIARPLKVTVKATQEVLAAREEPGSPSPAEEPSGS